MSEREVLTVDDFLTITESDLRYDPSRRHLPIWISDGNPFEIVTPEVIAPATGLSLTHGRQVGLPDMPLCVVLSTTQPHHKDVGGDPCPYCGHQKLSLWADAWRPDHSHLYWVACNACSARGPRQPTEDDAVQGWNGRYGQ